MVRTYKLYASVAASATAAAQVDIRRNGRVLGVQFCITPTQNPASGDYIIAEMSLYPSSQTQTNDGMGVLATCTAAAAILTSGAINSTVAYKPSFGVEVRVGDRLYLHCTESGNETWFVNVLVDVDEAA